MTPEQSLKDYLWRLGAAEDGADTLSGADLRRWPDTMAEEFIRRGLLAETTPAKAVPCPDCEDDHVEEVEFSQDMLHLFVRCPAYGRVEIEPGYRRRWKVEFRGLADLLRSGLALDGLPSELQPGRLWSLGIFRSSPPREVWLARGISWADAGGLMGRWTRGTQLLIEIDCEELPAGSVSAEDLLVWDGATLSLHGHPLELVSPQQNNTAVRPAANVFKQDATGWLIGLAGAQSLHYPKRAGLTDIHVLIRRPGESFLAIDLVGTKVNEARLGLTDEKAIAALRAALREGGAGADTEAIRKYLRATTGLSGGPRSGPNVLKRAASTVAHRIKRAIDMIAEHDADLAMHLRKAIETGVSVRYAPEKAVVWET